jgi:hypothetical protein
MLAANDGIFSSNNQYKYLSKGVILKSESDNIFEQFKEILQLKVNANIIRSDEYSRQLAEFESGRVRMVTVESAADRDSVFFENAENGRRKFELAGVRHVRSPINKVLQYLGALFAFCGVLTFLVEWRLRKASIGIEMVVAVTRVTTRYLKGLIADTSMASICSVTFIDPSSAPIPDPTLPAQIIAVTSGPNALIIAMPIREGSQEVAPKSSSEGRDCLVKTTPVMNPVSVINESDLMPIS